MSVQGREGGEGARAQVEGAGSAWGSTASGGACLLMCRETAQGDETNSEPSNVHEAGGGGQAIGLLQGDEKWTEAEFLRILRKVI